MSVWPRIIIHADMDAFYAAIEQRDQPHLRGQPVLIGPNSYRGVVLTASYEARPYGVGSAMPVAEARRRCPQAIMVPPRFEHYQTVSSQVMDVLAHFSPRVEALSLDEAFLDMSGAEYFFGPPREMGERIKQAVYEATGLHISVGVAGSKYVAKVASGHDKPNGLTLVPQEQAKDWLAPLPVTRLWGVGRKTQPKLEALGLSCIGDIANSDLRWLTSELGRLGSHLFALSHAQDPRRVSRGRVAKSIGSDRTLSADVYRPKDIARHIQRSADRIARRVRYKNYTARGIRLRLKTTDHKLLSRQCRIAPSDTAAAFYAAGLKLLAQFDEPGPFRLVGLTAFDLDWQQCDRQLNLFDDPKPRALEQTMDKLASRYGSEVLVRAKDLRHKGTLTDGMNLDFLDYRDGERVSAPG